MSLLELIQAVVLGLVQGLTEFLPISSSGHLLLVPALLGWQDPGAGFTAIIQLGTVLAVLLYFGKDLVATASGWFASLRDPARRASWEARLGWAMIWGTVPIIVIGLALEGPIDTWFRSPLIAAGTLIGFALLLWWAEKRGARVKTLEQVSVKDGVIVGLWQCLALIPGSSRSGCTITGALFLGYERSTAARLSFLLSVPSVLASGLYKLMKDAGELQNPAPGLLGVWPTVVATLVAFVSGYAAIAFLIKFLQTRTTMVFIVYRIVLGLIILGLVAAGVMEAWGVSPSP